MMNEEEKAKFDSLIASADKAIKDYVEYKGIKYPMTDWVTITEYCKRFNIPRTQTVTTWIRRGVIPKSHVITIPEYNNIRLIKAVPYQE